jgi:hypothetical protein
VSDNNDKRSDYGTSSPKKKTTYKAPTKSTKSYGGSKPSSDYKPTKSYGGSKPSHNTRPSGNYGSKISYGKSNGKSHGNNGALHSQRGNHGYGNRGGHKGGKQSAY